MMELNTLGFYVIAYLGVGLVKLALALMTFPTAYAVYMGHAMKKGEVHNQRSFWGTTFLYFFMVVVVSVLGWPMALIEEGWKFFKPYTKEQTRDMVLMAANLHIPRE